VQDADDPGRALVGRGLQREPVDQALVGGHAGDRDRARVRYVGQQRAHRDDHLTPIASASSITFSQKVRHRIAGSGAAEQDQVARSARILAS
jgi:hypothetical protein